MTAATAHGRLRNAEWVVVKRLQEPETAISTLRGVIARALAVVALALLASAPLASAQKAIDITPASIVGIKLGMPQAKAAALLAKPVRFDRLEEGYQRYVSGKQKVEAYFQQGAPGVVALTTWNRLLKTDKQIGPCSTIAALKRAYGGKLKPYLRARRVVAYRLGNLIFTVAPKQKVGVVGLGRGNGAVYIALNAPACV
jgi:hypothetical protein